MDFWWEEEKFGRWKFGKIEKNLEILFPPTILPLLARISAPGTIKKHWIIQTNPTGGFLFFFFFRCSCSSLFLWGNSSVVWFCSVSWRIYVAGIHPPTEAGSTVSRTPEELLTELRRVLITKALVEGLKDVTTSRWERLGSLQPPKLYIYI